MLCIGVRVNVKPVMGLMIDQKLVPLCVKENAKLCDTQCGWGSNAILGIVATMDMTYEIAEAFFNFPLPGS